MTKILVRKIWVTWITAAILAVTILNVVPLFAYDYIEAYVVNISTYVIIIIIIVGTINLTRSYHKKIAKDLKNLLIQVELDKLMNELTQISNRPDIYRTHKYNFLYFLGEYHKLKNDLQNYESIMEKYGNEVNEQFLKKDTTKKKRMQYLAIYSQSHRNIIFHYVDNFLEWADYVFEYLDDFKKNDPKHYEIVKYSCSELYVNLYNFYKFGEIDIQVIEDTKGTSPYETVTKYKALHNYYTNINDKKNADRIKDIYNGLNIKYIHID